MKPEDFKVGERVQSASCYWLHGEVRGHFGPADAPYAVLIHWDGCSDPNALSKWESCDLRLASVAEVL
jgi:hypothetical protein